MYTEALNTYQVIVKNKMFSNAGRLKVNMANIYFKQKNYTKAIKFYRMALDQISNAHNAMRIKIMQNIGVVFIHMGQYSDAITSFEYIMSESPNIKTGFNLILCYYAIGDRERMKKAFQKLICVPLGIDDDDKYIPPNDDPHANMVIEAIKNDKLHQMERERKALAEKYIMTSAKFIAPAIESSFAAGFDWCVDMVKGSQYVELANDLEINKAITYLRQRDFRQAVETLKMFEKKDSRVKSAAATNLSFLYFLEKDYDQADRYAELAMSADRYNPAALTYYFYSLWILLNNMCCFFQLSIFTEILEEHHSFEIQVFRKIINYTVGLSKLLKNYEYELYSNLKCKISVRKCLQIQHGLFGCVFSDSGQSNHGTSAKGERLSVKLKTLPGSNEPYEASTQQEIDASYVDPLGPQMQRPKTAARKRTEEDEFADEELGDDLLPE
uniref:Intraflagellar transport protein 88 homolog n=1 Tax=Sinocyclocheilus grahami TaxID=75366 RepID=A0A672Q7N1_SINGR